MNQWKATATLTDGERQWDVVILRAYDSLEGILVSVQGFASHGYDIVQVRIERESRRAAACNIE